MDELLTEEEIKRNKEFFPEPTKHDWPEDFKYENGNYINACAHCGKNFRGYKRRIICRVCGSTMPKE